ncbi:MAG: hypothetical protein NTU53_19260 [Planctomycetota bacterium]|nr:hypothetical protein [Planctomycetota bacterium]
MITIVNAIAGARMRPLGGGCCTRSSGCGEPTETRGASRLTRFADPERERQKRLDVVADRINENFGKRTIRRGGVE